MEVESDQKMRATRRYKAHTEANIFPMMSDKELKSLAQSISDHGQAVPIEIFEGKIIDGRNRCKACRIAGVEPQFVDVTERLAGCDKFDYVFDKNDERRHLTTAQRATAAAKYSQLKKVKKTAKVAQNKGKAPTLGPNGPKVSGKATAVAAEKFGVSERSTKRALKVQRGGSTATRSALDHGKISLESAAKISDLPKPEQAAAVREEIAPSPAEQADMETEAKAIRSWAGSVTRMIHDLPKSAWFDDTHRDIILSQLKSAASAARCKIGAGACVKCDAKGCKFCRKTGWLPKFEREQLQ